MSYYFSKDTLRIYPISVTIYKIVHMVVLFAPTVDSVFSVEVWGNETQFTLRGLQSGQTYRLRIAAGTTVGFGVPSEWVEHKTPPNDSDDSMGKKNIR